MSFSDRTHTSTYDFPDGRVAKIISVYRERRDPCTGQVCNQRLMSRNVSLEGFTLEEERVFISLYIKGDYRGIAREFEIRRVG